METTRDNAGSLGVAAAVKEQQTVVHESGHQFGLEHEDDYNGTPDDPSDDYIMTDKLVEQVGGMPPRVHFSPVSLDKIRDRDYP